jgi:hypothetical protein
MCPVNSARALSVKELMGKMDPYTVVTISGSKDDKFKTSQEQHNEEGKASNNDTTQN